MQNSGLNFQEISSDESNSNFSEFSAIYKNFRTSLTGNFVSIRPSSWNLQNFLFNGQPLGNSTISGISGLGLSRLCSATFCCSTFCTFCLRSNFLATFGIVLETFWQFQRAPFQHFTSTIGPRLFWGTWYGNFRGKFPENPKNVEFSRSEPFNRNSENSRWKIKRNGNSRYNVSENLGIPREVVSFPEIP